MKAVLILTSWLVVLSVLLLMPTAALEIDNFAIQDKLIHCTLFAVLTIFILNCFKKYNCTAYILAFALSSVYGFAIECLQDVVNTGRYFDKFDIIANIIGSLIGSAIFYILRKLKS